MAEQMVMYHPTLDRHVLIHDARAFALSYEKAGWEPSTMEALLAQQEADAAASSAPSSAPESTTPSPKLVVVLDDSASTGQDSD